jgi:hypothetical protein
MRRSGRAFGVPGSAAENGSQINLDFPDPTLQPLVGNLRLNGEFRVRLNGEAKPVLERDAAGADGLAAEHWRAEEPTATSTGLGDAFLRIPITQVRKGSQIPLRHAALGDDELAAHSGGEQIAGLVGVPVGPVLATSEGGVNVAVDVAYRFVGTNANADIAGMIGGVAAAIDFTSQVHGDHPWDIGRLNFNEWADGLGEVFEEERVDGDAGITTRQPDAGGGGFVEQVPGDGSGWIVAGARCGGGIGQGQPHSSAGAGVFRQGSEQAAPGCRARVSDLGQSGELRALLAEQLREAADSIKVNMTQEGPARLPGIFRGVTETDSDVFAEFLGGGEPGGDGIAGGWGHIVASSIGRRDGPVNRSGRRHGGFEAPLVPVRGGEPRARVEMRGWLARGAEAGYSPRALVMSGDDKRACPDHGRWELSSRWMGATVRVARWVGEREWGERGGAQAASGRDCF